MELVANDLQVERFITESLGFYRQGGKSIGVMDGKEIVAGVLYEDFTGHNCFMHVAAKPNRYWLNRKTLFAFFAYPFITLNCDRVTGWVESSNKEARRLDEHLGFSLEGVLHGAARDGGDVLLYVMWKQDCRYLDERFARSAG